MTYQQDMLSKSDFAHLISSPGSSFFEYLAYNENIVLEECFSHGSGFSKSWLLKHHYALKDRDLEYNYIPPVKLYRMKNCSLMQPLYEVSINSKLLWESFHSKFATENYLFNNSHQYRLISHQKSLDLQINGPLFIIPHRWYDTNYYHWTIETLARFRVWQTTKKKVKNLKILMNRFKSNSFQDQWLKIMGINHEDCIFMDEDKNYHLENIFYCASVGTNHCSYSNVKLINQLVSEGNFENNSNIERTNQFSKIFVCRKKGSVRSIHNHDEVMKIMMDKGFQVIYSEDFTISEQIKIFYSAQYIVGIHGSGLANIIFAQSNSHILELMPESSINPCFFDLANAKKQSYGYIVCKCSGAKNNQLLYVNPTLLSDHLDVLLCK